MIINKELERMWKAGLRKIANSLNQMFLLPRFEQLATRNVTA
jgi:hypothetical protein